MSLYRNRRLLLICLSLLVIFTNSKVVAGLESDCKKTAGTPAEISERVIEEEKDKEEKRNGLTLPSSIYDLDDRFGDLRGQKTSMRSMLKSLSRPLLKYRLEARYARNDWKPASKDKKIKPRRWSLNYPVQSDLEMSDSMKSPFARNRYIDLDPEWHQFLEHQMAEQRMFQKRRDFVTDLGKRFEEFRADLGKRSSSELHYNDQEQQQVV